MDFRDLVIKIKLIIFTFTSNSVFFSNFVHFVVPDKIKGDFVYLITEVLRGRQYGCIINKF